MGPFDYVNSINTNKKDIMNDDLDEKQYEAYLVNKSLSYFPDTVFYSNEMNRRHHLDNKLQYQYLLNIVRPKKRFAKWVKRHSSEDLEIVKRFYNYSNQKAEQVLSVLTPEQIKIIKERLAEGGVKK